MEGGDPISPNPQMESHMMRLATFRNLPESASLSPAMASKAGLYYTGPGDTVACYSCGLRLNHWQSGIQPMTVHRRLSPECQFVVAQPSDNVSTEEVVTGTSRTSPEGDNHHQRRRRGYNSRYDYYTQLAAVAGSRHASSGTNTDRTSDVTSPINSSHVYSNVDRFTSRRMMERINNNDPTLVEEMKYERRRLSSYTNWPRGTNIAPEALAQAGLFYLYRADRVKCAFCGGILRNWGPSEEPLRKHRQLFPLCPFLRNPRSAGNGALDEESEDDQIMDNTSNSTNRGGVTGRRRFPSMDAEQRNNVVSRRHRSSNTAIYNRSLDSAAGDDSRLAHNDGERSSSRPSSVQRDSIDSLTQVAVRTTDILDDSGVAGLSGFADLSNVTNSSGFANMSGIADPSDIADISDISDHPDTVDTSGNADNSTIANFTGLADASSHADLSNFSDLNTENSRTSFAERIDNNDPGLLVEMKYERRRLATYSDWPGDVVNIAPEALAQAGLFYLGLAARVKCAFCGGILRNWEPLDEPAREHRRNFPHCQFLRDPRAAGNVAIGEEPQLTQVLNATDYTTSTGSDRQLGIETARLRHPAMAVEGERLASFDRWPRNSPVTPETLARAGFYYTGGSDVVRCFCCDGPVNRWQRNDNPVTEHRRLFPQCGFVRLIVNDTADHIQPTNEPGAEGPAAAATVDETIIPNPTPQDAGALSQSLTLTCSVCLDAERNIVFLPCCHLVCCNTCSWKLSACPVCRSVNTGFLHVYIP